MTANPDTLATADERKMIDRIKRAVDLVDNRGMTPNDAIIKVARDDKLLPGAIDLVCRAYNTGRQLGQWRANTSIMDKLASFPLADSDKVKGSIYPKAETHKEAFDKSAFSEEYHLSPAWLPNERALEVSRLDLKPMIKLADSKCHVCGHSPCTCAKCGTDGECSKCGCYPCSCDGPRGDDEGQGSSTEEMSGEKCGSSEWRMRKAYGNYERAKIACDESRRYAQSLEDNLKGEVATLVGYFKQASYNRMPFAQVEHAAVVYHGPAACELLKIAYERARLREPRADKTPMSKLAFDLSGKPFDIIEHCVKLAEDLITARQWAKEAEDLMKEVEAHDLRPFANPDAVLKQAASSGQPSLRLFEEKQGYWPMVAGSAIGNAAGTMLGSFPKSKADLIEDEWLELESPEHQNELRKIKTHAMLNSILTDDDDPISGHDPDKVLSAYNELAQTAPRAADNAAILKPLLRKRLAGNVEPFEAKELVDIEKGLRDTKNIPPSTSIIGAAPDNLLG